MTTQGESRPQTPKKNPTQHPTTLPASAAGPLTLQSPLIIRLGILQLAKELGCIAEACRRASISRTTFYKMKRAYDLEGHSGLQPTPRRKPRMPNAFSEAVVDQVLEETRKFPSYSYNRIAERLRTQGLKISGSGVRKIWKRKGLNRGTDRRVWSQRELNQPPSRASPAS